MSSFFFKTPDISRRSGEILKFLQILNSPMEHTSIRSAAAAICSVTKGFAFIA